MSSYPPSQSNCEPQDGLGLLLSPEKKPMEGLKWGPVEGGFDREPLGHLEADIQTPAESNLLSTCRGLGGCSPLSSFSSFLVHVNVTRPR